MKRKLHDPILVGGFNLANDSYPESNLAVNRRPCAASHNQLKWLAAWALYDRQEGRKTNDHIKQTFPQGSYGVTAEGGKSYNRVGLTFQVLYIELPDRVEGQRILEDLIALTKEAEYNVLNNHVSSVSDSNNSANSSDKRRKSPVAVITTESDEECMVDEEETSKAAKASSINKKQRTVLGAIDDSQGYELNPPKQEYPKSKGEFKSAMEVHYLAYSNGAYSGTIGKYSRERTGRGVYKWTKGKQSACSDDSFYLLLLAMRFIPS